MTRLGAQEASVAKPIAGSIAVMLNMNPGVSVVGVRTQVDSSRGSSWATGSSAARYGPSQAILYLSWARCLICPVYQAGNSSSGATFRTCQTGSVEITQGASGARADGQRRQRRAGRREPL
jgi:hypothetical protein